MANRYRMNRRQFTTAAAAAGAAASATFAVPNIIKAQDAVTLRYFLWDTNQQPAYQECADKFTEANPNITIQIEQLVWDDYWTALQTGMVSGDVPDVFTNHLSRYPELAGRGQLVDIQPLVERDGVDVDQYEGELAELWSRDGARYGLPKDWDTIAVVYNKEMLDAAGIDPAIFDEWTWNPDDGGTFHETIAALTVDEAGNTGADEGFDKSKVTQYGWGHELGDAYGQTAWSHFAASLGWNFIDAPWTPPFHYDDERVIKTIQYLADLKNVHGFSVPEDQVSTMNMEAVFAARTAAIIPVGSWLINWIADNVDFEFGFGRLPSGPEGRKSMFNGLADSIWTGSEHQEEAWEWVKYLGSAEAQEIIGSWGVVFPAIPSAAEAAQAAWDEKGLDVSPYLDQAQEEDGTFLFPIVDQASEFVAIVTPVFQSVALGDAQAADVFPGMNDEVNALY
ncbi:MAG TPA: sugar ABC transporter substrate-binding protein [Thermomicrobiales bacterium]|jgi:multiple sugar transport system substrate-binding protein|nr:sugar ABC transporter substrate-binding protein [Thermomicrobiales bacterium]